MVQKEVQMILEERELWLTRELNLVYPILECLACHLMAKCKVCIKESRCSFCMEKKTHSNKCTPKRTCNECCRRKKRCTYVFKKYCTRYAGRIRKKC